MSNRVRHGVVNLVILFAAIGCGSPTMPTDGGGGCRTAETECAGTCTDTSSDPDNCGACGASCAMGEVCASGACSLSCPGGLMQCGRSCRDVAVDPLNCGACEMLCAAGQVCSAGSCESSCGAALTECDGVCRDVMTDRFNCGACGTECPPGQLCSMGTCQVSCGGGLTECSGVCRDLATDRINCGACDGACASAELCSAGVCALSCGGGLTDCAGVCRDLDTDRSNCGACGTPCPAGDVCSTGVCGVSCGGGLMDCSGVCRDLSTDRLNCGACATMCVTGEVCSAGGCAASCGTGLTECTGACFDLTLDPNHCGACATSCAAGELCLSGSCSSRCGVGSMFCGTACTDTSTDLDNCGGCGTVCPTAPMATATCIAGSCGLACGPGTADCDGDSSNGCEGVPASGAGAGCPAVTCLELLVRDPTTTDGRYWIDPNGGSISDSVNVFCDMTSGGGGWTQLEDFDRPTGDVCLGAWVALSSPPPDVCHRDVAAAGWRAASIAALGIGYVEVRGQVQGLQFRSTEAFAPTGRTLPATVDTNYVDGVAISTGTPRSHIWSYAASLNDDLMPASSACPCLGGSAAPGFIGSHFFCESGQLGPPEMMWYSGDPLWDGDGFGSDCDTPSDASWFYRHLGAITVTPIEVRLVADQPSADEDIGVSHLELLVREAEICDGVDNDFDGLVDEPGSCMASPGISCLSIRDGSGWTGDGVYWIDPDGDGTAVEVYCDQSRDGGGWTLVTICRPQDNTCWNNAAVGEITNPESATSGKLADTDIRAILTTGERTTRGFWRQVERSDATNPTATVVFNLIVSPAAWDSTGCGSTGNQFLAKQATVMDVRADMTALSAMADAMAYGAPISTMGTGCSCASNGWSNLRQDSCGLATWFASCESGPSMSHCCACAVERADLQVWAR